MKETEVIYIHNYSIFSRARQEKYIQCILYSYLDWGTELQLLKISIKF